MYAPVSILRCWRGVQLTTRTVYSQTTCLALSSRRCKDTRDIASSPISAAPSTPRCTSAWRWPLSVTPLYPVLARHAHPSATTSRLSATTPLLPEAALDLMSTACSTAIGKSIIILTVRSYQRIILQYSMSMRFGSIA